MFSDTGSFASSGPFMGFVDNKNKKFSSKDPFIQTILKSVNLITNWRRRQKIR